LQQVGHTDPKITLGSYAKVMFRQDGEKDKLRQLIEGVDCAQLGTNSDSAPGRGALSRDGVAEIGLVAKDPEDGHGRFRTSDLSRVKRRTAS
jgi:hypothetical protein